MTLPMTVTPLAGLDGPCRCDTRAHPHSIEPACYLPGRAPRVGPADPPVTLDPLDLADQLETAHAEGYAEGLDDQPDAVSVDAVRTALAEERLTKRVREKLAEALDLEPDEIGIQR